MTKKPVNKALNRQMKAVLTVIMLAAVLLAIWLFAAPALERQNRAGQLAALLESIETGDGTITVNDRFDAGDVDFYDGGAEAPEVEIMAFFAATPQEETQPAEPITETAQPDNGVITGLGVLTIDSIDLKLPVAEGVDTAQLKIAVGHVPQTAAIGDTGNAVIAGHRSYDYGQFFNRLGEVQTGDLIQYQPKDGEVMTFAVDEILEIVPGDQTAFEQPDDKAQITLYTCTPIKVATHRLLIRATRII